MYVKGIYHLQYKANRVTTYAYQTELARFKFPVTYMMLVAKEAQSDQPIMKRFRHTLFLKNDKKRQLRKAYNRIHCSEPHNF